MPHARDLPAVAVLGQGSIGRRHARLLVAEGCRVMAHDPALDEAPVPGTEWFANEEHALAEADAAVVASPSSAHLAQARRAVEAGCHTLVEKPMSTSSDGVADLLDLASRGNRVLAVAMNLRFHPGPLGVHELVSGGAIGRALTGHFTFGSYLPGWRPGTDYRQAYSARRDLGGGVLLDAVHELDYATWVMGPASRVSAHLAHMSDLELDVEDVASLRLHFESGALGSVDLDYLDRGYRRGCRVVGSDGSVAWDWGREEIVIHRPEGTEARPAPSDVDPSYRDQMAAFVAAVRDGGSELDGTGLVSGHEALHALRVVDAARESSADGRRVEVAPR